MCRDKLLNQDNANMRNLHLCQSRGTTFEIRKKEYRLHRQTRKKKTNDDEEVDILGIDLDTIELELI